VPRSSIPEMLSPSFLIVAPERPSNLSCCAVPASQRRLGPMRRLGRDRGFPVPGRSSGGTSRVIDPDPGIVQINLPHLTPGFERAGRERRDLDLFVPFPDMIAVPPRETASCRRTLVGAPHPQFGEVSFQRCGIRERFAVRLQHRGDFGLIQGEDPEILCASSDFSSRASPGSRQIQLVDLRPGTDQSTPAS